MDEAVLVVDSDPAAAAQLAGELTRHGLRVRTTPGGLALPEALAASQPAVVLFSYHFDRPNELLACSAARLAVPNARILAVGTIGPAMKFLREWNRTNRVLDRILERPMPEGQLVATVEELLRALRLERESASRAERLRQLLPEGALRALEHEAAADEELFDAAVVFTDVRRSSELIVRHAPREFFRLLNESLTLQSARVRAFRGAVVKYTGDGMMAVFRGMGRSHLALRCAAALAQPQVQSAMPFGVGVAQGLVLAGFVGDSAAAGQRRQYDVIGATVHLAARLCSHADAGEVVATQSALAASGLKWRGREIGQLQVRGFDAPIDCVAIRMDEGNNDGTTIQRGRGQPGAGPGAGVPVRMSGPGLPGDLRTA
ncbi:adenylate/guanylate cyclase domain-containing protein [Ramlibacter sp.]|uniref:adenylate/guanylate cyclase domain-containing protein n=1 Tax=Ramlibacter sp. TaxID=1917967 RepID=UPI003D11EFBA